MAAQAASIASAASRPLRSTPRPNLVTVLRRSIGVTRPSSTSATSRRVELEPMSMTATRSGSGSGSEGIPRTLVESPAPSVAGVAALQALRIGPPDLRLGAREGAGKDVLVARLDPRKDAGGDLLRGGVGDRWVGQHLGADPGRIDAVDADPAGPQFRPDGLGH